MKSYVKYVIAIILIIIFTVSVVPKTFQNDTFYVIALGDYIIENGIDRVDHFSWHNDLEYRYPHWLFDVINGGLYNSFGLDGLYIFVCILSVIFMLLLFWLMLKKNIGFFIAFISTLIVTYMMKDSFMDRGQIISYIMFLIEINLIESFLKNKNKLSVVGLFIVACVIANVHATAWIMFLVLFLPYITEYFVSLYTLKNISISRVSKYQKKLDKLKKQNPNDIEQINKIEEKIKDDKDFLAIYKENEKSKILINKNDNAKWLILVMIIASLGALVTPIGSVPFTYYIKSAARKFTFLYK